MSGGLYHVTLTEYESSMLMVKFSGAIAGCVPIVVNGTGTEGLGEQSPYFRLYCGSAVVITYAV